MAGSKREQQAAELRRLREENQRLLTLLKHIAERAEDNSGRCIDCSSIAALAYETFRGIDHSRPEAAR